MIFVGIVSLPVSGDKFGCYLGALSFGVGRCLDIFDTFGVPE